MGANSNPRQEGRNRKREERRRQADFARKYRKDDPSIRRSELRRWLGFALLGLGAVVAVTHVLEHLGAFQIIGALWDDLLFGYPMALVLGVIGAIFVSPRRG